MCVCMYMSFVLCECVLCVVCQCVHVGMSTSVFGFTKNVCKKYVCIHVY